MENNYVSIPIERYEELLKKEFLVTSILEGPKDDLDHINWAIQVYLNTETK